MDTSAPTSITLDLAGMKQIRKLSYYSIREVLESHGVMRNANILAKTLCGNHFLNVHKEDFIVVTSLLKDKVYQLYIEHSAVFEQNLTIEHNKIQHIMRQVTLRDANDEKYSFERVMDSVFRDYLSHSRWLIAFAKDLPGFNQLGLEDMTALIRDRVYFLIGIRFFEYYLNGENYRLLSDGQVQYSRKWMARVLGENFCAAIFTFHEEFNKLEITKKEAILLIPVLLTSPGKMNRTCLH